MMHVSVLHYLVYAQVENLALIALIAIHGCTQIYTAHAIPFLSDQPKQLTMHCYIHPSSCVMLNEDTLA